MEEQGRIPEDWEELRGIWERLAANLTPKRLAHSLGVARTAAELAPRAGVEVARARLAGLLHDCAHDYPDEVLLQKAVEIGIVIDEICRMRPDLLHAAVGAWVAEHEYGVKDPEVLTAIRLHTLGGETMSELARVVCLADYIEPGRTFAGVEVLRELARQDLTLALKAGFVYTLKHLLEKGDFIHPQTVGAWNSLVKATS